MSYFRYKMIRRNGQVLKGIAEFPFNAPAAVHEHLEQRGLTVITIERINEFEGRIHKLIDSYSRWRVKPEELIEFLRNMGIMLRSGVPILTTLEDATAYSENKTLIKVADDIRMNIETGMQFSDATNLHYDVFPDTVRHLIRIGEETGNLDRLLMDAANHLDRLLQISTDTRKSLIYPSFTFIAILAATMFWVYYVVPGMADLFRNMNVELPAITLFVMGAVEYLEESLLFILAIFSLTLLAIYLCIKLIPWVRIRFHEALTKLPIIGKIVRASNLAFIAEYFSLFTSSGVDILSSLQTLQNAVPNQFYRKQVADIREGLIRGNSLTEEFGRSKVFPSFVVRMINVGEQSGNLSEQLQYLAADYRRRLNNIVDRISEIMRPLLILVVGAFFVFIVIALFLPIYHLVGQISLKSSY